MKLPKTRARFFASASLRSRVARFGGLVVAFWLALATLAAVKAETLRSMLDKPTVNVGKTVVLTLVVDGQQDAEPELPLWSDLEVLGQSKSKNVVLFNGRMDVKYIYKYTLLAKKVGTFSLKDIKVKLKGSWQTAEPLTLKVLATSPEAALANQQRSISSIAEVQEQQHQPLFVIAEVSNLRPYVGEQIIYTWKFYRQLRIAEPRLEMANFSGFLVEDFGGQKEDAVTLEEKDYRVIELKKALFPLEAKKLTIPATTLTVRVQGGGGGFDPLFGNPFADFFNEGQTKILKTTPITLEVQPLPEPKPADFSGAVGQFNLEAELSRQELPVNETTTLTLTLSGNAHLQALNLPEWSSLPGYKIYSDKPKVSIDRQGDELLVQKIYKKALIPLQVGEQVLPPLSFSYFDPQQQKYLTKQTKPLTLQVLEPSEEQRGAEPTSKWPLQKKEVEIIAEDIRTIYKKDNALAKGGIELKPQLLKRGFFLGSVLPVLIAALCWLVKRYGVWFKRERGPREAKNFLEELKSWSVKDLNQAPPEVFRQIALTLRQYLGVAFKVEGQALTNEEILRYLQRAGCREELLTRLKQLLNDLEALAYGLRAGDNLDLEHLRADLRLLLKDLAIELGKD